MYQGSEAKRFDSHEFAPQIQTRPEFQVREGAALDYNVRRGVDAQFLSLIKLCLSAVLVVCCIGAIRVFMTAATAQTLAQASSLRVQIDQAQALESDLKVEQSVLSRGTRIARIASEQYGMVMTGVPEKLVLPQQTTSKIAQVNKHH